MSIKELFGHAIGVVKFGDIAKFYNWFTKRDHTLKGDITFEGGVDVTAATLTGLPPAYATEIAAIDAGLAFGDKYVDSDGIVQTVTKIKQTITLAAGGNTMFGFLIDLSSLDSQDLLDVLPGYTGSLATFDGGLYKLFSSSQNPAFNNLSVFTNGRGYIAVPLVAYTIDLYGEPLSVDYHTNLVPGNNAVVHNAETITDDEATAWIGLTISSTQTFLGGVSTANPTTWTKGQGYIVTTSDGPQAAIGSPSTPVPVDRSNGAVGQVLVPDSNGDAVWGTPSWTTATRPTPLTGQYPMGFNTTTSTHEGWDGSTWNDLY
jgi:hypothetical protein